MPPRTQFKVQGAADRTTWTLSQNKAIPVHAAHAVVVDIMQAKGHYYDQYEQPLPRYESIDGSQYSMQSGRTSSAMMNGGGNYDQFDFNMPLDDHPNQQPSRPISVNTNVRPQNHDVVGRHLLYETALMDTQHFEILDIAEVDALKKEHERLNKRIEGAQRQLALESKIRDAAQNMQRLYSTTKRPDTPQSPESPNKSKTSLLNRHKGSVDRRSGGPEVAAQADSELSATIKKVDQLHEQVKELVERRQYVERKLLRHTAAVLAEEANKVAESAVPGVTNGHRTLGDDDASIYSPNEFDGIRDILHGKPAGASQKGAKYEQEMAGIQDRLEELNSQLRHVIDEASRTLGKPPAAELALDQSDDASARVENRFTRLEDNLYALQQQQEDIKTHYSRIQESEHATRVAVERQLEGMNNQLHSAVILASDNQPVPGLEQPPQVSGHGYQSQLQYMEESLMTMEQLLQQHSQALQSARDASESSSRAMEKAGEYQTVVGGLWEILQSAPPSPNLSDEGADSQSRESFSLQAFSSRVQHLFSRVQSASEQHDILRRQVQQQRELNGKSDAEKDAQFAELQEQHDQLGQEHAAMQQELANVIVQHQQSESMANQSRDELMNVMNEVDELKRTMETKEKEREDYARQVAQLLDEQSAAQQKQSEVHTDLENLEAEVVRLSTELTMAKAELDGAYGSRAERKGAQAAEVEALTEKNKALETELQEMTSEFQELTKESIELEKEREQLDSLIDTLRDRCDSLESQLSDERVRWMGMKSPSTPNQDAPAPREATSIASMRQEFKKMMREQRMEGVKLVRAEQEERRKLEAELRKLRQANGPVSKNLVSASGASTPA